MTFSISTFTAPSGAFAAVAGYRAGELVQGSFVPVYNPTVLNKYTGSYGTEKSFEVGSDEWSAAVRKYSTRVTSSDFDHYGEKLVDLTSYVVSFNPHCSLGPLRGAAKPCVMAEVMSRGACQYEFFNFQGNSVQATHPRIIADLSEILKRRDPGEEVYRINVTDAGRGGNGINNLVSLLGVVKEKNPSFRKQKWELDLNLVHDQVSKASVANIERVLKEHPQGLDIRLNRYPVPSLIVEDFNPALAFSLDWDGQRQVFKPCAEPGKFLYQTGNEVHLIQTENSYLAFEELYSRAITEHLTTAPDLKQVDVVWQEYQDKDLG